MYALTTMPTAISWLPQHSAGRPPGTAGALPWAAPGVIDSTPVSLVRTSVSVGNNDSGRAVLPLPYAPTQLQVSDGSDGWVESAGSLMVFNNGLDMAGLAVHACRVRRPLPRAANIPDQSALTSIQSEYGSYRGPDRTASRGIATAHTVGATTPLQKAHGPGELVPQQLQLQPQAGTSRP